MPASRLDSLMSQLADLETDDLAVVNNCIELYSGSFTNEQFKNWSLGGEIGKMINRCFKFDSVEEILTALKKEGLSKDSKVILLIGCRICIKTIKSNAGSISNEFKSNIGSITKGS